MKPLLAMLRFVSRRELAARPVRSFLMIGTVAVGVALLTAMHVATESIVGGFAGDLERLSGRADLQVTFGTGELGFSEDLLAKVAALPVVEQAAAMVRSQITFEDGERETVELFGIDLLQAHVLDLYEVQVLAREADDFTILNDPRGVFLTDVLAKERNLDLGSKVRLSAVDGIHDYTVRGIVAAKGLGEFLGGRLVAMYLPAAQPVAGKQGSLISSMVDQIDVRLRPGTKLAEAELLLNENLGKGFHAATPLQRRMVGERTVEGLRATLVGMSSLALLAAVFIIYASTTTMVMERLAPMATLVSVGASPTLLVWSVVAESAMLGMIGSFLGVGLGVSLASLVGSDAAAGMGLNYSLPFDSARVSWDPLVVLVFHPLGGVVVAATSAYFPARRLRTLTPLALQRDEDALINRSMWSMREVVLGAGIPCSLGLAALHLGVTHHLPDWIALGGMAFIGGAVVATLPLLRGFWLAMGWILTRRFGIAGRITAENFLRTMDRSLVTASAITLSVAIAVGAGSLVQSFRASVAGWYGFAADALVSSRSVSGGWLAAPVGGELEDRLQQLPSVADVQTLRVLQGQPYRGERVAVAGLSEGMLRRAVSRGRVVGNLNREGATRKMILGQGVAVSENFVAHFALDGSPPELLLPAVTGEVRLPIVAVVPDYISDKGSVILSRDLTSSLWGDGLVNYCVVTLREGMSVDDLSHEVGSLLTGGGGLAVTATHQMVERVDRLIGRAFSDIDTIMLLVLFLTIVGIADLGITNVLSRSRELSVLRLIGLTNSQLLRTARFEGLCIAVGASLCGVAVGGLCAWVWVNYNYPALVGYVLGLEVAWGSIAASLVLATAAAWVAATVAARYALRQPALAAARAD